MLIFTRDIILTIKEIYLLTLALDDLPASDAASALALLNQLAAASALLIPDGVGDFEVLGGGDLLALGGSLLKVLDEDLADAGYR